MCLMRDRRIRRASRTVLRANGVGDTDDPFDNIFGFWTRWKRRRRQDMARRSLMTGISSVVLGIVALG